MNSTRGTSSLTLSACLAAGALLLSSFIGAAGAADTAKKAGAAAGEAAPGALAAAPSHAVEGVEEFWSGLFAVGAERARPVLSLDVRPDEPGLIGGVSSDGTEFTLVALEVTPISVDDASIASFVTAEEIEAFREAQGDASLVYGFVRTADGVRLTLGASSTLRTPEGALETVFVPLASAAGGEISVCLPGFFDRRGFEPFSGDEASGDERNGGIWGYCRCVAQILKCELLTAGCIAAAPAGFAACAGPCAGTLGLGCVACIVAALAGTVALCDSALDCWTVAQNKRCTP